MPFWAVAIVAVYHHGALIADRLHDFRHLAHHRFGVNTAQAVGGAAGAGQRGRNVQGGAKADLTQDAKKGVGMDLGAHAVEYADTGLRDALGPPAVQCIPR